MGLLFQGGRRARISEPLRWQVRRCRQNVVARRLIDTSAAAPGCEDEECGEAYLGAQIALTSDADWHALRSLERGPYPSVPQRIYFSSSTDAAENWLPRASVSSRPRAWSMLSRQSPPAITATFASPGWTPATLLTGTPITAALQTAARLGRRETRVSRYVPGYSVHRKKPASVSLRRLLQHGHRQSRRHADRLGRRPQLPVARIHLALQRPLAG